MSLNTADRSEMLTIFFQTLSKVDSANNGKDHSGNDQNERSNSEAAQKRPICERPRNSSVSCCKPGGSHEPSIYDGIKHKGPSKKKNERNAPENKDEILHLSPNGIPALRSINLVRDISRHENK